VDIFLCPTRLASIHNDNIEYYILTLATKQIASFLVFNSNYKKAHKMCTKKSCGFLFHSDIFILFVYSGYVHIGKKTKNKISTIEHSLVWTMNELNQVQKMLWETLDDKTKFAILPIWCNMWKFWINRDQNVTNLEPFEDIKWIHQRKRLVWTITREMFVPYALIYIATWLYKKNFTSQLYCKVFPCSEQG